MVNTSVDVNVVPSRSKLVIFAGVEEGSYLRWLGGWYRKIPEIRINSSDGTIGVRNVIHIKDNCFDFINETTIVDVARSATVTVYVDYLSR